MEHIEATDQPIVGLASDRPRSEENTATVGSVPPTSDCDLSISLVLGLLVGESLLDLALETGGLLQG